MQRRAFLSQFLRGASSNLSAPYAAAQADYSACADCPGYCIDACEEETGVLKRNDDGRPYLDLKVAGCTFCAKCRDACPEGVLSGEPRIPLATVWISAASCLAHNGTVCVSCVQVCPEQAIDMNNLFNPHINDKCTGCGLCVSACPVGAVKWSG